MSEGMRLRKDDAPEVADIIKRVETHTGAQVSQEVRDLRTAVDANTTAMAVMTERIEHVATAIEKSANHTERIAICEAKIEGAKGNIGWLYTLVLTAIGASLSLWGGLLTGIIKAK